MARAQAGICAEPNLHGLTLLLNVMTDDVLSMRRKLSRVPAILGELDDRFSEAMLNGVVAVGSDYWDVVYPSQRPAHLQSFPDFSGGDNSGDRQAPRESIDILLQIRSDRFDANFLAARTLMEWFGHDVELIEQIRSFRFLDGRDLTGFIDSPDNPKAMKKRQAALISHDDDPVFAGGSYLFVQKFRHNLRRWEQLGPEAQEELMGRRKVTGERISEASSSSVTHAGKSRLLDDDEQPLLLLRQNMPWGDLREQGLLAMYYATQPSAVVHWLKQRYQADEHGDYDPLLDYTQAVASAAYFAPSIEFLENG